MQSSPRSDAGVPDVQNRLRRFMRKDPEPCIKPHTAHTALWTCQVHSHYLDIGASRGLHVPGHRMKRRTRGVTHARFTSDRAGAVPSRPILGARPGRRPVRAPMSPWSGHVRESLAGERTIT